MIGDNPRYRGIALSPSTLEAVLSAVFAETQVAPREILSEVCNQRVAHARQYAMWKLRQMIRNGQPRYSMKEIGRHFNRDHSTVVHAVEQVEKRLAALAVAA